MTRKLLITAALLALTAPAMAQTPAPACADPHAFAAPVMNFSNTRYREAYDPGAPKDWVALMQQNSRTSALTDAANEYSYSGCDYRSAMDAFTNLRADTDDQTALANWLDNQDRVFAACETKDAKDLTPPPANPRFLAEFAYQRLAQAYHLDNKAADPEAWRIIAYDPTHPRQRDAARTLIDILYVKSGIKAAWTETEHLATDPATAEIYPQIEDVRFQIMGMDRGEYDVVRDLETQQKMLRWILGILHGDTGQTARLPTAQRAEIRAARMADAQYGIETYLVPELHEHDADGKPLPPVTDWWMNAEKPASVRLQAVQSLITQDSLLALRQVQQTETYSLQQRLYDPENPIWSQQARISDYAYDRFKNCGGIEWLRPALAHAVPARQPRLDAMIADARAALNDHSIDRIDGDERFALWAATVEALLLQNRNDDALTVLLDPSLEFRMGWNHNRSAIAAEALRFFIHTGQYDMGRKALARMDETRRSAWYGDTPYGPSAVILADTPEALLARLPQLTAGEAADPILEPVWNMIPRAKLLAAAATPGDMDTRTRQNLVIAAFMRSWLLHDDKGAREAALALEKLDDTGDKSLIAALAQSRFEQTLYILNHPRFRPFAVGFADEGAWNAGNIDQYNHNDNNWWCSLDPTTPQTQMTDRWALAWDMTYPVKIDITKYASLRDTAIKAHPIWSVADKTELAALEKIESGPAYLTNAVLDKAGYRGWKAFVMPDARLPEALHLAVRTTRYGCENDGSHASYSRAAYALLHRAFRDSPFTTATPYWFAGLNYNRTPQADAE